MDVTGKIRSGNLFAESILNSKKIPFDGLVPSALDELQGVYIIRSKEDGEVLYVGKTTNLRTRLYTNHLQGNYSTARLKKYLIEDRANDLQDYGEAKEWIKQHCYFQFLEEEDYRLRGQLEGLFTFVFNVKYIEK